MINRKLASILLAMCMVLSLAACSTKPATESSSQNVSGTPAVIPTDTATPEPEGPDRISTFIVGTTSEITSANRSEYNFDVISGTISQLAPVWIDEDGNYQPLLCDYSTEDSKVWVFTVREGMTWHDGIPVTAEDIEFTLKYLDTQTDGGYAEGYDEISVTSDTTIELELSEPNPRQLSSLTTLRILPKHIYDGVEDYTTVANELANIGCGPYMYKRFDAAAGVVEFTAFDSFPDGRPAADTVILKLFDNEDTMYMSLKSEEIDMIYKYSGGVSAAVIDDLQASGNLTLMPVSNTANSASFIFNNNTIPGNDINIRKAIASAIDYAKFRELFGSEYAVESTAGFIPAGSYGYIETAPLTRDLAKAEQYLADAGCADSDGDGYVEYNGEKLSITIMLRGDKPDHARYAELMLNNLAEVGIEIVLDVQEVASFRELTEQQRAQTSVITGLTAFGMGMNQGLASLYLWGENPMSYGQVYDNDFKSLLDRADAATSMDEYKTVAADIQNYYAETIPAIALFWDAHVQAFNSRYNGFEVDGTFGIMNVQTWMTLSAD